MADYHQQARKQLRLRRETLTDISFAQNQTDTSILKKAWEGIVLGGAVHTMRGAV